MLPPTQLGLFSIEEAMWVRFPDLLSEHKRLRNDFAWVCEILAEKDLFEDDKEALLAVVAETIDKVPPPEASRG